MGHKTASVVMSQAFGYPSFPVDTHIHRLAQRWKLTSGQSVVQTEMDLKTLFPKEKWNKLHLQIIFYGRQHCQARSCHGLECDICKTVNPGRKKTIITKKPEGFIWFYFKDKKSGMAFLISPNPSIPLNKKSIPEKPTPCFLKTIPIFVNFSSFIPKKSRLFRNKRLI